MAPNSYMVRVACRTYNHAPFIKDALNGFCMQKTTFPFVCTIFDDASCDGTQEVITAFLSEHFDLCDIITCRQEETDDYCLTFAQHNINKNCFFAVFLLRYNHFSVKKSIRPYMKKWYNNSKYFAVCEGDDYWIDSLKLQKQVDFMEKHPNHTLCVHAYRRDEYYDEGVVSKEVHEYQNNVDILPDKDVVCNMGLLAATASMLYRADAVVDMPSWKKNAPVGDKSLQLVLFGRGHISYIDEVMSVYRIGVPGSWTKRILLSHKQNKKLVSEFCNMMTDFNNWSNHRYQSLVRRAIKKYRWLYMKREIIGYKNNFLTIFKRSINR